MSALSLVFGSIKRACATGLLVAASLGSAAAEPDTLAQPVKWKSMVLNFPDSQFGKSTEGLTVSFAAEDGYNGTTMTVSLGSGPKYTVKDTRFDVWLLGGACVQIPEDGDAASLVVVIIPAPPQYHKRTKFYIRNLGRPDRQPSHTTEPVSYSSYGC